MKKLIKNVIDDCQNRVNNLKIFNAKPLLKNNSYDSEIKLEKEESNKQIKT